MWSYPIIKDGLIYVVDLRNGLYILEFDGPLDQEVDRINFLEGNSNLGTPFASSRWEIPQLLRKLAARRVARRRSVSEMAVRRD